MKDINVLKAYPVSDEMVLGLIETPSNALYEVQITYMGDLIVFTLMGTKDKSQAERFYELIKQAYEEMIY